MISPENAKFQLLQKRQSRNFFRRLINSPVLPELKKNADRSLTLFIQKHEPTDPVHKGKLASGAERADL